MSKVTYTEMSTEAPWLSCDQTLYQIPLDFPKPTIRPVKVSALRASCMSMSNLRISNLALPAPNQCSLSRPSMFYVTEYSPLFIS
ncbi:hypothetical protein TNCV_3994271 [Trichonephila clavipes]|uniref:Uncharacterized protein n=1 Tax=Trichonephila clavipes TaxID=2585209 RepID=A0A8X6VSM0_TRICX|nr:hypothetical protein TNCV_3994271 [Trichonephila clavipes]